VLTGEQWCELKVTQVNRFSSLNCWLMTLTAHYQNGNVGWFPVNLNTVVSAQSQKVYKMNKDHHYTNKMIRNMVSVPDPTMP